MEGKEIMIFEIFQELKTGQQESQKHDLFSK